MKDKNSFNHQFRGGYYPDQHWDESERRNGPPVSSPSTVRKRQGISLGSQTEAYPGMVGKQSYKPKRRSK